MADEHRLDFRGSKPLAGDFDRVVGAAENVPKSVFIDGSPVAVHPDVRETAPVSLLIALSIVPESARHADPGFTDDELADLTAHGGSRLIDDVGGDAGNRAGKSTRLERRQHVAAHETAGGLRAARVIDDRQAPFARRLKIPMPRVGIPWFAGGTEHAQAGKIALLHPL